MRFPTLEELEQHATGTAQVVHVDADLDNQTKKCTVIRMLSSLPQLVINMALDSMEEQLSHRLSVVATGILTNVAIASRLRVLLMFLATVQHPLLFLRQQTIVHLRTQSVLIGKHISTLRLQASIIQTQATTIHVIRSRQEVSLLLNLLRLAPGG